MTGLLLVVCYRTLARRLQMHDHQSWSLNVEHGDRRVLPSGVENTQCLQHLIGRAFYRLFRNGAAYVNFLPVITITLTSC